ncbi:related to SAE2-Meiotic recombination protein [Zygosaccharomyces bailii ISA1307]|nr:related to SAE2-Meiotic recombination protein [Zygosaccharomyces bailii ISA1307]
MRLQSNLPVLLDFDLRRLLAVQSDVTVLISKRVRELLHSNEDNSGSLAENQVNSSKTNENAKILDALARSEEEEDSEAFILTQLDYATKEKLTSQEHEEMMIIPTTLSKPDISSPLKDSQNFSDSSECHATNSKKHCEEDDAADRMEYNEAKELPKKILFASKKPCIRPTKVTEPLINLNANPITGKPWILEDFKRNEKIDNMRKSRKNIKIQNFYKKGCPPANVKWNFLGDGSMAENSEDRLYEFENLRERSHSPPGFGRLDFPSTQERYDDKRKSQNIIFHKTKWRFCKAACNLVSLEEREYLFKNDELNRIVDSGLFEWDDAKLQIYMR